MIQVHFDILEKLLLMLLIDSKNSKYMVKDMQMLDNKDNQEMVGIDDNNLDQESRNNNSHFCFLI